MEVTKEPIIAIKNLKINFGEKQVLNGVSLNVYRGQIIGYIGSNGAGKSTTIKIMLGLIEGYTGEVRILGQDISGGNVDYKKKIGYVPETAEIYDSLTAREYLTFIGELYGLDYKNVDQKAQKLMKVLGIEEVYDSRMTSYSKGMKQKVVIISSLLHNPDILFWDEPLSGLDANSVMIVKEILSELVSEGKTIFYSSHIMDVVEKVSNRIILINNGQVAVDGSFDELKHRCKEESLEDIFNELTGFKEYKSKAEEFVSIVQEVKNDEGF